MNTFLNVSSRRFIQISKSIVLSQVVGVEEVGHCDPRPPPKVHCSRVKMIKSFTDVIFNNAKQLRDHSLQHSSAL